jgi:myosin heavy subunit
LKTQRAGNNDVWPISLNTVQFSFGICTTHQVTGKAIVEYFFDPSLILDENTASATSAASFKTPSKRNSDAGDSIIFSSKHLFSPCTIVKSLSDDGGGGGTGSKKNKKKNKRKSTADLSGPALVKTSDGTLYKIQDAMQLIALTSPDDYIGISDVLHLANVSEASLLHTLRMRYKRDEIYTSAGPILISVNPYRPITISSSGGTTLAGESFYSESVMMRYRMSDNFSEEDPHLFQVADRAYRAMMDSVHTIPHLEDNDPDHVVNSPSKLGVAPGQVLNQSIIISGESGAGKTEATKYIMQYLARITKKKGRWSVDQEAPFLSPDGKAVAALEDRVLSSNPLLETFGNAQTLRNDNSSRFGKFIHINFSTDTGIIVGAQISNYLLEKTRITTQIEGERNYHIFYQLFSGSGPEQLLELGLDEGTSAFRYLGNRSFPKNEKDSADFSETLSCLSMVGLASEEQSVVVRMVAAVLHLGNISFMETESEDHSAVVSEGSRRSLRKACELLGLDDGVVSEAILTKLLNVNGKIIKKSSTVAMAEDKRDALAKMTYSCLFVWLVKSINRKLRQHECIKGYMGDNKTGFIGVLDIYGFECFDVNGYEQLLINYCNEKLQRHFNRHLFEVEQNLYSSEGVDWTYITFNDNRPCLELIEGGSGVVGILNTLDDSYAGMGSNGEKEVKFVAQLHKLFGSVAGAKLMNEGHESFITPKFGSDRQFSIVHYAGEVRFRERECFASITSSLIFVVYLCTDRSDIQPTGLWRKIWKA